MSEVILVEIQRDDLVFCIESFNATSNDPLTDFLPNALDFSTSSFLVGELHFGQLLSNGAGATVLASLGNSTHQSSIVYAAVLSETNILSSKERVYQVCREFAVFNVRAIFFVIRTENFAVRTDNLSGLIDTGIR